MRAHLLRERECLLGALQPDALAIVPRLRGAPLTSSALLMHPHLLSTLFIHASLMPVVCQFKRVRRVQNRKGGVPGVQQEGRRWMHPTGQSPLLPTPAPAFPLLRGSGRTSETAHLMTGGRRCGPLQHVSRCSCTSTHAQGSLVAHEGRLPSSMNF